MFRGVFSPLPYFLLGCRCRCTPFLLHPLGRESKRSWVLNMTLSLISRAALLWGVRMAVFLMSSKSLRVPSSFRKAHRITSSSQLETISSGKFTKPQRPFALPVPIVSRKLKDLVNYACYFANSSCWGPVRKLRRSVSFWKRWKPRQLLRVCVTICSSLSFALRETTGRSCFQSPPRRMY